MRRSPRVGNERPSLCARLGRYSSKELSRLEGIAELGAEDAGERFDGQQKVFACGAPAAGSAQAAAGDEVMNVRMMKQLAGPGMQYADHANAAADEPWILSQLQQGGGRSAKEQVKLAF